MYTTKYRWIGAGIGFVLGWVIPIGLTSIIFAIAGYFIGRTVDRKQMTGATTNNKQSNMRQNSVSNTGAVQDTTMSINQLAVLYDQKYISDTEFQKYKQKIIAGVGQVTAITVQQVKESIDGIKALEQQNLLTREEAEMQRIKSLEDLIG